MIYIPRKGDIVIMDFDPQVGFEQKGRRPAMVISNDNYNRHCKMVMVCPITNTDKNHAFHIRLDKRTKTTGVILCDQVRAFDTIARNAVYKESAPDDIIDEAVDLICSFVE
ncbi:MAG: type II toxin-antitoxin system PemK/MazF family toxin [Oscillospiraceae bacterium]|nr:type II toxin-antitoxin system PemK/MazF family toxin [Oscillospiraceae bacterium]